jgi:hypothetical protein
MKNSTKLQTKRQLMLLAALTTGAIGAGCTEQEAHFADATPAQLERALAASSGDDMGTALIFGITFSGRSEPTACPAIKTTGQSTTVTGNCTDESGGRWDGSITIRNLPGIDENPAFDPTQPSSAEFDLRLTSPQGEELAIDGRVTVDAVAFSSDLTIDSNGIASTSRMKLSVNSSDLLTALSGSEIEIADLGNADVEGSWSFGDVPRGSITVRGADTLVFDIGRFVNGCVPYRIGNEQGSVCPLGADESSAQALVGTRPPIWSRLLLGTKP